MLLLLDLMAIGTMTMIHHRHFPIGGCGPGSCKMLRVHVVMNVAIPISTAVSIGLLLSVLAGIQTYSHSRITRHIVWKPERC